jgi:hypothetical protein
VSSPSPKRQRSVVWKNPRHNRMSCPSGTSTVWLTQNFPSNFFAGWDGKRRFQAILAWNFFEQVESSDAATRVRLGGTGWTPPKRGAFAEDASIWFPIVSDSNRLLYAEGQRLHQQLCPGLNWRSQRSYGISAVPVTNVLPYPLVPPPTS